MTGEKQLTPVDEVNESYPPSRIPPGMLFETQVVRTPNTVALVYYREEVSYRELDNQAIRVARHLRSLGVGPDVPIGICVQRSTDMVVGLLGILKAGGAYVPLAHSPPRRV